MKLGNKTGKKKKAALPPQTPIEIIAENNDTLPENKPELAGDKTLRAELSESSSTDKSTKSKISDNKKNKSSKMGILVTLILWGIVLGVVAYFMLPKFLPQSQGFIESVKAQILSVINKTDMPSMTDKTTAMPKHVVGNDQGVVKRVRPTRPVQSVPANVQKEIENQRQQLQQLQAELETIKNTAAATPQTVAPQAPLIQTIVADKDNLLRRYVLVQDAQRLVNNGGDYSVVLKALSAIWSERYDAITALPPAVISSRQLQEDFTKWLTEHEKANVTAADGVMGKVASSLSKVVTVKRKDADKTQPVSQLKEAVMSDRWSDVSELYTQLSAADQEPLATWIGQVKDRVTIQQTLQTWAVDLLNELTTVSNTPAGVPAADETPTTTEKTN